MIEGMIAGELVRSIGWSLVRFVWQGTLVAVVMALVFRVLGKRDARLRYAVACVGLLLMTALPVWTAFQNYQALASGASPAAVSETAPAAAAGGTELSTPSGISQVLGSTTTGWNLASAWAPETWLPVIVLVWFAGVGVLSLRLLGGWVVAFRMTRRAFPVGDEIARTVRALARRIRVLRPVRTLESALVEAPTVVGWLRPVVLIPASAIAGLSPEKLEALLAHELAHIRRHDYVVNLLQRVSETLLFYHPAVWWLSNRIRVEREHCADDVAVMACGDAILYAEALRDLEEGRVRARLALAATGGSLSARIGRLLGQASVRERRSPAGLALTFMLILVAVSVGAVSRTVAATVEPAAKVEPAAEEVQQAPRQVERAPAPASPEPRVQKEPEPKPAGTVIEPAGRPGTTTLEPGQENQTGGEWKGAALRDEEGRVVVVGVAPGSAAARSGLRAGDVITEFNGRAARAHIQELLSMAAEDMVELRILRNGQSRTLYVSDSAADPARIQDYYAAVVRTQGAVKLPPAEWTVQPGGYNVWSLQSGGFNFAGTLRLGLQVQNITPELRQFFGAGSDEGVLVSSVEENSAAAAAGIRVGDVIIAADGNPVRARADLTFSAEINDNAVTLKVVRDKTARDITVTLDLPRSWRITP